MLALLAAVLICLSGARAQSNTEYSFRQQSNSDYDHSYSPSPILTMDCLAANGYGQWTLSSANQYCPSMMQGPVYPAGWYLLENALRNPSTKYDPSDPVDFPGCIPPGVVDCSGYDGTYGQDFDTCSPATEPKATANLDGAITFIWPDVSRQTFDVWGFRKSDVDLSLSFLTFPANPVLPANIIAMPITSFPAISTTSGTATHNIVTAAPFQDEFDVCSDAAYLYITWCSNTHMSENIGPSEIWYEVLDINTMAPVLGPASAGSGMRPTIACDPRNNRYGGTTIHFDLAFIAPVNGSFVSEGTLLGGTPVWEDYNAGVWTTYPMSIYVLNPLGGENMKWYIASHVRALVSSVLGGAWNPACYAIVAGFDGDVLSPVLILYNLSDPHITPGIAAYVDGDRLPPYGIPLGNPNPTDPIPAPTPPQIGWPVKDAPIVAMANPYDNQDVSTDIPPNWREYDQFHCLYQLDLSQNPGQPANEINPLLIVRNADNGLTNPPPPDPNAGPTPPDTRLALNQVEITPHPPQPQLLPDPTTYCAAVNQMGIHVHWRTPDGWHFYARDMNRTFDEDIDENTLVTDQCTVSDGTAHGGTVGAAIKGYNHMTIWTDPN
ncbi:MAG TPA: hypothetical protein VFH95_08760, partial [Candidatus Kapabacteria bacterium]|nr:hypothetical protein [Candidatus Kapabacteria bacterium]